ncbi:hypothetical protein AB1286_20880, partial [Trinickia sp. NRRL B-1857]|uniref:hypothetical protein n=1 Tax=Trinickia sp. NRRL B-1857 TaxID=3162879 RepID=UPI003D27E225
MLIIEIILTGNRKRTHPAQAEPVVQRLDRRVGMRQLREHRSIARALPGINNPILMPHCNVTHPA